MMFCWYEPVLQSFAVGLGCCFQNPLVPCREGQFRATQWSSKKRTGNILQESRPERFTVKHNTKIPYNAQDHSIQQKLFWKEKLDIGNSFSDVPIMFSIYPSQISWVSVVGSYAWTSLGIMLWPRLRPYLSCFSLRKPSRKRSCLFE